MSPSIAVSSSSSSSSSSSGSDSKAPRVSVDEKKQRRMISNRESARRSRIRKQKLVVDLANEKAKLEKQLVEGYKEYSVITKCHFRLQSENDILTSEKMRLINHLEKVHLFLKYISDNRVDTKVES